MKDFMLAAFLTGAVWVFLGVWFGVNLTSSTHLTTTIAWGAFLSTWTLFTAMFLSLLTKMEAPGA